MFSLESLHPGDSNEYTQYTFIQYEKEKHHKIIPNLQLWDFSKGLQNVFETAVVNEPSVFEPLKFYCIISLPLSSKRRGTKALKNVLIHVLPCSCFIMFLMTTPIPSSN